MIKGKQIIYNYQLKLLYLREQSHTYACILDWLLGDCISESTAYCKKPKTYATRLAKAAHMYAVSVTCDFWLIVYQTQLDFKFHTR